MKLEEQMFNEVADWITSKQIKREFLKDKTFSNHKFNYWLKKYRDEHEPEQLEEFKELEIFSAAKNQSLQKIEITTPSGFVITIVEEC